MLYVIAPALLEIPILDLYDNPVFDGVYSEAGSPNFGLPKPQTQSYERFLLARLTDEGFYEHSGGKTGSDALDLIHLARRQIKAACAERATFHGFDNEVATRLQHSILRPKAGHLSGLAFEHNWYDWVQVWKTLHKEPPAVLNMPTPVAGLLTEVSP